MRARLRPATEVMIKDVEATTGKPVVLRPEPALAGRAYAAYAASDEDRSRYLVLYEPSAEPYLDHLIPHELGHVLLLEDAPEGDRLLAHIGHTERLASRNALSGELSSLTRGLLNNDPRGTDELLDLWSDGVVTQAASYPQDILIERMLYERYPQLRESQRESLDRQAREAQDGLDARLIAFTPKTVSVASLSMSYALLKSLAYLQEPWMTRPFRGTLSERVGEELLDMFRQHNPQSLQDCIAVTEA